MHIKTYSDYGSTDGAWDNFIAFPRERQYSLFFAHTSVLNAVTVDHIFCLELDESLKNQLYWQLS